MQTSTQYMCMEMNKYDCSFVSVPYIIYPLIFYDTWHPLLNFHLLNNIHWNLYKADTFGTFPSVRLIDGVRLIDVSKNSAMFVKD